MPSLKWLAEIFLILLFFAAFGIGVLIAVVVIGFWSYWSPIGVVCALAIIISCGIVAVVSAVCAIRRFSL